MQATIATAQLESFNPATAELVGAVPITPPEEVQAVVDAVAAAQTSWRALTLEERGRYLERAAHVVLEEDDDIRDLIVREQGKPRNEAFTMEILPTVPGADDEMIEVVRSTILGDETITEYVTRVQPDLDTDEKAVECNRIRRERALVVERLNRRLDGVRFVPVEPRALILN